MNELVKQIIDRAEFTGDRYSLPDEFAQALAEGLIRQVLDTIVELNINKCAYTTYDLSVQECARQEIIQGVAQAYAIRYYRLPPNVQTFPVRSTR
jgi:hypothetical protein